MASLLNATGGPQDDRKGLLSAAPELPAASLADAYERVAQALRSEEKPGRLAASIPTNPVGTEYTTGVGMPRGEFDPLVTTGGPLGTMTRGQVQEGAQTAMATALGLQGSLKVPTKAGNVARIDIRGPGNVSEDIAPATGRAVAKLLDDHIASGGIDLYGGRGEGTDIMVTLPPGLSRPADLAARSRGMVEQATAMTQGVKEGSTPPRYWYQEGAGALHEATGQDLDATRRLVAAHAIVSPKTNVADNSNAAINAWNQSLVGDPIRVKMEPQNAALERVLYGEGLPDTRKVGPFFANHMRYVDPAYMNDLTNDIWQMRQAGYVNVDKAGKVLPYEGTPSVGEDNFVRMMVDRTTRQLNADKVDGGGWTPDQTQAALWVHAKTLQETGQATANSFNFKNGLERLTAAQGDAHQAGPALLGPAASYPQAQAAFKEAAGHLLVDAQGRDIVNSSLGMLTPPGVPGAAAVSITGDGIKPSSRALMDASTLIRATLLRQPDALWTAHPDVKGLPPISAANVVKVQGTSRGLLQEALDAAGLGRAVVQPGPNGLLRVINLDRHSGVNNNEFQAAVKSATNGLSVDLTRARADYGYHTNDWTTDPTGSGYISALSRLPPNLQRVGDQLFAELGGRLDEAAARISRGTGGETGPWRVPGFAQAVGPIEQPLPLRQWLQRPSASAPGSRLGELLR